ncbi:bacteriophage protein [Pandoraea pnomenusa]|uniref:Bacteriophage protein n=2 Tax=Burkholderiaceae TaxID=119060 RepID=A0ABY6WN74_9BURK|nr:bacteriophage protein [Pandoraea pnomenusa]
MRWCCCVDLGYSLVVTMRYRKEDADGDYVLGGAAAFLVNSPEAVAQAVSTRLRLIQGEWFLDKTAGMPWKQVLGKNTQATADSAIKQCVLGTQGVVEITDYSSEFDADSRALAVTATINTIYGSTTIQETL